MEYIPADKMGVANLVGIFTMGCAPGELDTWMTYDRATSNVKYS